MTAASHAARKAARKESDKARQRSAPQTMRGKTMKLTTEAIHVHVHHHGIEHLTRSISGIPEEAIEAAAVAEWEFDGSYPGGTWETADPDYKDYLRRGAARALKAAAPHIRISDGYEAAIAQHLAREGEPATKWLEEQKAQARAQVLRDAADWLEAVDRPHSTASERLRVYATREATK